MLLLRPGDRRNWINLLNARAAVVGAKRRRTAVEWLFPVIDRTFPIEHKPLILECDLSNGGASLRGVFVQTDNLSVGSKETPDVALDFFSDSLIGYPRRSGGIYFESLPVRVQNSGRSRSVSHTRIDEEIRSIPGRPVELVKPHGHRTPGASLRLLLDALESSFANSIREIFQAFDEDIVGLVQGSAEASARDYFVEHRRLGLIPLNSYGDGIRKASYVIESLFRAQDGVLLIDEVEIALYHSVQVSFFRALRTIADSLHVQIFATTHSLDAVDGIITSMEDNLDDLAAFHLPDKGSDQPVKRMSGDIMKRLRFERGLDLR